jgi:hypothetical protein
LAKLLFVFKVHIRKHTTRNFLPNLYGTWKEIAERIKETLSSILSIRSNQTQPRMRVCHLFLFNLKCKQIWRK